MYDIKRISKYDDSIKRLYDFRTLVGKRNKSLKYFIWEYYWGNVETLIAEQKGKIIAQYSSQRYEAFFFGEKVNASLSFDTGTHPDFRRQGIFHTLGTKFFEEEGKQNIHFSTGFPNENFWTSGKNKFGWVGLFPIPLYANYEYKNINTKYSDKYKLECLLSFNNEFDKFSESFKDKIPIYLDRNSKYLNWRFVNKPSLDSIRYDYHKLKLKDKNDKMVAYLILKQYTDSDKKKTMQLVDFLIKQDYELYNHILHILVSYTTFFKCDYISLYANKYQPFCKFLKDNGFIFVDTNRVYIARANNDKLNKNLLFDERNHYITMGDCDVI